MSSLFHEALDILERTWGAFIAIGWGWWEWKGRKRKGAKAQVDTIQQLVRSVEDLSKKYDHLLDENLRLREEVADLKIELHGRNQIISQMQSRIDELEQQIK